MEHYRLGSTGVILSRTFCNADEIGDLKAVEELFTEQMALVRNFEASLAEKTEQDYLENLKLVKEYVDQAVQMIRQRQTAG